MNAVTALLHPRVELSASDHVLHIPLAPVVLEFARANGFDNVTDWIAWQEKHDDVHIDEWVNLYGSVVFDAVEAAAHLLEMAAAPLLMPFGGSIFNGVNFGSGHPTLAEFNAAVDDWATPEGHYELSVSDVTRMRAMAAAALALNGAEAWRLAVEISREWAAESLNRGDEGLDKHFATEMLAIVNHNPETRVERQAREFAERPQKP